MAFFGLTSLGGQNPFHASQEVPLHVFTNEDFDYAWKTVAKDSTAIALCDLENIVRAIYRCPDGIQTPEVAYDSVKKAFQQYYHGDVTTKDITFESYRETMNTLKSASEQHDGEFFNKSCEYKSIKEYSASLAKHERMTRGPREKYDAPLTNSQQIGWTKPKPEDMPARLPKKSCDETKFASAMVQAGVYY